MKLRGILPSLISQPATYLAVSMAMAKQMPCAGRMTAVLTPMTSPRELTSGPPELPGFNAASVWITSSISRPVLARKERPQGADDPSRHGALKPVGIADRDGKLTHAHIPGIAQPDGMRSEERRVGKECRSR